MPYPIFFPSHTSIATGCRPVGWWWFDADLVSTDQGPFPSREWAVFEWACALLEETLLDECVALDRLLALPLLAGGAAAAPIETSHLLQLQQAFALVDDFAQAVPDHWFAQAS